MNKFLLHTLKTQTSLLKVNISLYIYILVTYFILDSKYSYHSYHGKYCHLYSIFRSVLYLTLLGLLTLSFIISYFTCSR